MLRQQISLFFICFVLSSVTLASGPAGQSGWNRKTFSEPEELVEYFATINYTLANWQSGDRSVPRVYLTHVPARWRNHYAGELTTTDKKKYFFFMLAPMVLRANELITEQREFVIEMQKQKRWTDQQRQQLQSIANEYGTAAPNNSSDSAAFKQLLVRVDVIPTSLAMAQAAIESGWGTSRFAAEGNALFGQWTWGEDSITPEKVRTELGNYGIRSFKTPFESITAYMNNLNTHSAYQDLRNLRAQARAAGQPLSGNQLASGLLKYSERGNAYVKEIRALIRVNGLAATDVAFLRDGKPVMLEPVGADA